MTAQVANVSRTAGDTAEHVIQLGRCVLYGVYPELTTTGTITIRDGAASDASGTTKHVCALGLTQAGKTFGPKGIQFLLGLTVQLSVASDLSAIVWEALP